MNEQATLFENARIRTLNEAMPRAEALLVQGERIAAVGSRDEVLAAAPPNARRVDLGGYAVLPGFNDCHCHILSFGLTLGQVDVSAGKVRNIEELKAVVGRRAEETAAGEWVLGNGYDQNRLAERRHPTRRDLDEISATHPIVLWHTSGHGLTANSRALQLAGITAATPTPPGGDIIRDEHGEPAGVLFETPAMNLMDRVIPSPTVEQGTEAILQAMRAMAREGITSASDAATGEEESLDAVLEMYRRAQGSGNLAGRISLMPQIACVAPPDKDTVRRGEDFSAGDAPLWLNIGPTKIFSDGALTTRTAALREPFIDSPDNRGILIWEPDVLADMIMRAHRAGWQIATHAIGDRAIGLVLDCYERALAAHPRPDHRHRIEHCMLLDLPAAQRMARMGIIAALQPGFIERLGNAYIAGLGMERASRLNPMRTFADAGVQVAFSSDRPVIPGAPLTGIQSAVQRLTPDGVLLGIEHKISAIEGVIHYTQGSAFATRTEGDRGTLKPGMLADFVVLSHDPEALPPEIVTQIRVLMTVAGGMVTFEQS